MELTNGAGLSVEVIPRGASIVALRTPDREGRVANIVLGYRDRTRYGPGHEYFGTVVGRYANRIGRGRFTLDGRTYQLATNDGTNHLHGGIRGFNAVDWSCEPFDAGVRCSYTSVDGEEGYPGTLQAQVTYTVTSDNALVIDYVATTDAPTVVNLTQHSYFNLSGEGADSILGHVLSVDAGRYLPIDATSIPLGQLSPVDGTPFDFRTPHAIGARIHDPHPQLQVAGGYDHTFVLNAGGLLAHAARVVDPGTGRTLDVSTTEPGLQFYSGNYLDGTAIGPSGHAYPRRSGLCLETHHFPDSPNQPQFPSTVLRPGERHVSRTVFRFSVVP